MSDNNQDKPDEYETIFADSSEGKKNDDPFESVVAEFSEVEYGGSPAVVDAEVSDIDDGDDNSFGNDLDGEDGIFAPDPIKNNQKSGKSAGLLGVVALLAVAGVGGYAYLSNPEMIEQVKQNILGEGEEATVEPVAVQEEVVPQPSEMPTDVAVVVPETAPADVETAPQLMSSPSPDAVVVPPVPVELPVAEAVPIETPPVSEVPVSEGPAAETPAVIAPVATDVTPPPLSPAVPDVAPVPESEVPVAETSPQPEIAPVLPPKEEAKPIAEPKVTAKEQEAAPVIVESKEEQKVIADAKLDKYFDSPNGKMLKDIPAPSMDPKKGSNESIIVVGKKAQNTSSKTKKDASVSISTTSLDTEVVAAGRAMSLERYDAAREMYNELYRLNPHDERVLMGRAILFQKTGDMERAMNAYEEVLKYNPDNADAVVNLAGLIRKQYPAVALNKLLDLHQRYPNNPVIVAQLGVSYADSGNYQDAFQNLSRAAEIDPSNPQHYYNLAVVAEKASDTKKAIANYEKALEVDAIYGDGKKNVSRERIYDRLAKLRGN